MKHLKTFERINKMPSYYKIPTYPLEVYVVALTKVGMTTDEILKWKNNYQAQYWNNPNFKFIYLNHTYHDYSKEYHWSWSDKININKAVIEITVEDYEIYANKFNI